MKLLLLTFNEPRKGQIIHVDGERWEIARVLSFTGTVARLELQAA